MMNDNDNIDFCTYSKKWQTYSLVLEENQRKIHDYQERKRSADRQPRSLNATKLLSSGLQAAIADLGQEVSTQQAEEREADDRLAQLTELESGLAEEVRLAVQSLGRTQEELDECQRNGLRTRDNLREMRLKTTTLKSEVKNAKEERKTIALQHKAMSVLFGRLTGIMKVDVTKEDRSTIQLDLARGRGALYVPMRSNEVPSSAADELWDELLQAYEVDNSEILATLSTRQSAAVLASAPPPGRIEKNRESIIF